MITATEMLLRYENTNNFQMQQLSTTKDDNHAVTGSSEQSV